jgi:hypothetical protein
MSPISTNEQFHAACDKLAENFKAESSMQEAIRNQKQALCNLENDLLLVRATRGDLAEAINDFLRTTAN